MGKSVVVEITSYLYKQDCVFTIIQQVRRYINQMMKNLKLSCFSSFVFIRSGGFKQLIICVLC